MTPSATGLLRACADAVRQRAFAFVPGEQTLAAFGEPARAAWKAFADTWDDLAIDRHMGDGGRYRRRRYAVLAAPAHTGPLVRQPHAPHYQSVAYNRLNGGIERHFEPIAEAAMATPTLQAALHWGLALYRDLFSGHAAHVEVHQFRIEARPGVRGLPTPEGAHRDGVDFVLVMMVRRENIASGVTQIFDPQGTRLDSFTLAQPGDIALVDDHRALHGVTPVTPLDEALPAWRDVLVATYRRTGSTPAP